MSRKAEDLTGQRFGYLTVIRRATKEECSPYKGKHARWICQCDCGRIRNIASNKLKEGSTISCGCKDRTSPKQNHYIPNRQYFEDLTGQRFGKLLVLQRIDKRGQHYIWKCQCDCGGLTEVSSTNLKTGHTTSCGCNRQWGNGRASKGEEKIVSILKEAKIPFEREKTFSDMKKHGNHLRFDFYLADKKTALEFNGAAHYQQIDFFHKNQQEFQKRQEYDRYKISYCLSHGITIYCIPYWELDNLHTAADLFNPRFRATSKWKNDLDWQQHKNLTHRR